MSIAYPLIRLSISHTSHVATGKSTRPRGARLRRTICDFWSRNFNPRARMGRDTSRTPIRASPCSFNPRARVGRDSLWTSLSQSFASFNPRARLGRNFLHTTSPAVVTLFQSTRPRGARPSPRNVRPCPLLFQSTRPRGARLLDCNSYTDSALVSIHAPAWGATSLGNGDTGPHSCFNPRARVGRDLPSSTSRPLPTCFNPCARVGRDTRSPDGASIKLCFNPRARVGRDSV